MRLSYIPALVVAFTFTFMCAPLYSETSTPDIDTVLSAAVEVPDDSPDVTAVSAVVGEAADVLIEVTDDEVAIEGGGDKDTDSDGEETSSSTIAIVIGGIIAGILTIFGGIITKYSTGFLKAKEEEAKTRSKDVTLTQIQQSRYVIESALYAAVGQLNESEMPKLFAKAQDGKITKDEAMEWLHGLKDKAIAIAIDDLAVQGIDMLSVVGTDWAASKIRSFVDEKSPFLGPTVDALFDKGGDLISEQGNKYLGILSKKLLTDKEA